MTVEFTAADLNALIARHPDFDDLRGKFRVAIADSILTLDMSVPLRDVPFPKIQASVAERHGALRPALSRRQFQFLAPLADGEWARIADQCSGELRRAL